MSIPTPDISGSPYAPATQRRCQPLACGCLLFQEIDLAIFSLDSSGRIVDLNPAAARMANRPSGDLIGRHYDSLILPKHHVRLRELWRKVCQGQKQTLELTNVNAQGQPQVIRLLAMAQLSPEGSITAVFVTVSDVTQSRRQARHAILENRLLERRVVQRTAELIRANRRLQAEIAVRQAAQQAADHLAAIVASSDDAIIRLASDGTILSWNDAAERFYGYRPSEVIGCSLKRLCPSDGQLIGQMLHRISRGEHVSHFETPLRRQDGQLVDVSLALSPVCDSQGAVVGASAIARDMTQRKQMEQALRDSEERYRQLANRLQAMTVQLSLMEEQERRQVAMDLHDGLGQTLTLSQIKLNQLQKQPELTGQQQIALAEIERLVGQANQSVRSLTFQISPPVLYDLGLSPALHWLAEDLLRQYDFHVAVQEDSDLPAIEEHWPVVLFRAIRELLLNAFKHSGAKRASVRLFREDAHFCLQVRDSGAGFDPSSVQSRGFGLLSIQQRVNHLGGSVRVRSAPGHGTCVTIRVPLNSRTSFGGITNGGGGYR